MGSLVGLLLVLVVAVGLVGCSSSDPLAVEFRHSPAHERANSFDASGLAVDDDVVCGHGTEEIVGYESVDGVELSRQEVDEVIGQAMDAGTVGEIVIVEEWTCSDDSGSFTMRFNNRIDFATLEPEGEHDVGTWEITEGTGAYSALTGSGEVTLDLDAGLMFETGEVQS